MPRVKRLTDRQVFMRRTASILRHQRERNAVSDDCTLEWLRGMAMIAIKDGCAYCFGPVTAANLSLDHATPQQRGGGIDPPNLVVCCAPCNEAKGQLMVAEYLALLLTIQAWPADVAKRFLARLRQGGQFRRGRK